MKITKWKAKLFLVLCMVLFFTYVPETVEASQTVDYVIGETVTTYDDETSFIYYNFTVPNKMDLKLSVTLGNAYSDSYYSGILVNEVSIKKDTYETVLRDWEVMCGTTAEKTLTLSAGDYSLRLYRSDLSDYSITLSDVSVYTTNLKASKSVLKMAVEDTLNINDYITIVPADSYSSITYKTSNKKVATIDKKGKVKAVGLGKTTISAKLKNGKYVKFTVIVNKMDYEIAIDYGKSSLTSYVKQISNYKKGKWSSSKKSIATVDSKGKLDGISQGKTTVTFKVGSDKYIINTYVYDLDKLEASAIKYLKDVLKNPSSLQINEVHHLQSIVVIDYSAMNGFGGYNREDLIAYYDHDFNENYFTD